MSRAPVAAARSTRSAADGERVKSECLTNLRSGAFASLTPIQAAFRMSSCGNRPVRRASPVKLLKSITCGSVSLGISIRGLRTQI